MSDQDVQAAVEHLRSWEPDMPSRYGNALGLVLDALEARPTKEEALRAMQRTWTGSLALEGREVVLAAVLAERGARKA
jgi:hypothetical protein